MATKQMRVDKGQYGYIPVKDNSHGGIDLGRVDNGKTVEMYTDRPAEYGWTQILPIYKSSTGENWVQLDKLFPVPETADNIVGKYIVEVTIRKAE